MPHMGWNEIQINQEHPVLRGIQSGAEFYFVHSYYTIPDTEEHIYATTEYGFHFAVAIGHKNLFATQFHPEKSGQLGLDLLHNFFHWDGEL